MKRVSDVKDIAKVVFILNFESIFFVMVFLLKKKIEITRVDINVAMGNVNWASCGPSSVIFLLVKSFRFWLFAIARMQNAKAIINEIKDVNMAASVYL